MSDTASASEHRDRLDELCRRLFELLRDPAASAAAKHAALREILAAPGMDQADIRRDLEAWLADVIVHYGSAADPLLEEARKAFKWDQPQRGQDSAAVGKMLAHLDAKADKPAIEMLIAVLAVVCIAVASWSALHRQAADPGQPPPARRPDIRSCRIAARAATLTPDAGLTCREALKANPQSLVVRSDLALILMRRKDWPGARKIWDAVLALNPTDARALYARGVARLATKDADGIIDVNHALAIDREVTTEFFDYGFGPPPEARVGEWPTIVRLPQPRQDGVRRNSIISRPDWIRKPSGEAVSRVYPPLALDRGHPGDVTLVCQIAAQGDVHNCIVRSELPQDLGFAEAGLTLSKSVRLKPRTVDGVPVADAPVVIPLHFRLD